MGNLNGILLIDKEDDWTSFDVIAKLRGILSTRRIGHSGTLDPMATGLLVIYLGKATRAVDIISDDSKTYIADFELGFRTNTQDITGQVTQRTDRGASVQELEAVIDSFKGKILQTPPMYSAVQIDGVRLYKMAREGREINRPKREIQVFSLNLLEFDGKRGKLEAHVSGGTYVRTLIDDIGEKLGTLATLTGLRRTKVGGFNVEDARTLSDMQYLRDTNNLESAVIPVDTVFADLEKMDISREDTKKLLNGATVKNYNNYPENQKIRVYYEGEFIGISVVNDNKLKVFKNLCERDMV